MAHPMLGMRNIQANRADILAMAMTVGLDSGTPRN